MKFEYCSYSRRTGHTYTDSVRLSDAADDGEPESGRSFVVLHGFFCTIVLVEEMGQLLHGDAYPIVGNYDRAVRVLASPALYMHVTTFVGINDRIRK